MDIHDDRPCALGEGALWHPLRRQLFWFDILGRRLLSREGDRPLAWEFEEMVSAAGWISEDALLIAGQSGLFRLHLGTGAREPVAAFPAAPHLRSNDGRADPWGGFWISRMGLAAEPGAGGIWRFHGGEFRALRDGITIPNALCFDAERRIGYFADTGRGLMWAQPLDAEGWPVGEPRLFQDFAAQGLNPDGAVVDAAGNLWIAQWGAGRVACHAPDGRLIGSEPFAARHVTCPAFGGPELDRLFVTSAQQDIPVAELGPGTPHGLTYARRVGARGRAEPAVRLA